MDSVETSLLLGLDVEAWLSEGLVDVLIVGMGFMPFTLRLDQWKALGERYGVPIYPSLNTRPLRRFHKNRLNRSSAWHEYIHAAAAWWWHNGAGGIYLFNLFTHENECGLEKKRVHALLKEVGDAAALAGKHKLYGIESLDVAGMFSHGSETTLLPIPLDIHERRLSLSMGPDADDPAIRFELHALTRGGSADTKILMRLNHTLLKVVPQDNRHTAEVPTGIMQVGRNELSIWCNADLAKTASPIIVHEVLISAIY